MQVVRQVCQEHNDLDELFTNLIFRSHLSRYVRNFGFGDVGFMKRLMTFVAFVFAITLAFATVPFVHADEWNEQTKVTFNQAMEIPGTVLPAGSYWFVLVNSDSSRDVVRIFSSDWSKLYATVQTVPTERQHASGDTTFTFAERPAAKPEAILTWFYPGTTSGHEFRYSKTEEKELAKDVHQNLVVGPDGSGFVGGN
jgi:hypothetical protein